MKQILLMIAAAVLVGCGEFKEGFKKGFDRQKKAAEAKAAAEKKAAEASKLPQQTKAKSDKLIADPIVEKAVRKSLEKPKGKLTEADLEKVTTLYLDRHHLTELPKGLEKLTQLKVLRLSYNKLTKVKALEKLVQLEELYLETNQLTDVKSLEKLTQLKKLVLSSNQLTNVKGLEKLTQLKALYLHINQLADVEGLEKLTNLSKLYVQNNPRLTKLQIDELQKALPKCEIRHTAAK